MWMVVEFGGTAGGTLAAVVVVFCWMGADTERMEGAEAGGEL